MTPQNIVEFVNERIAAVPMEKRSYQLVGKTAFLRTLVHSLLVESAEAKEVMKELCLCSDISWESGVSIPTLALSVSLKEGNPYGILSFRTTVDFPLMKFVRRREKTSATQETLIIDHAEMSKWMAKRTSIEDMYNNVFLRFKNIGQHAIQEVKKIDKVLSLAGRDAVLDMLYAIDILPYSTSLNLNWSENSSNKDSIFDDDYRKMILSLEEKGVEEP